MLATVIDLLAWGVLGVLLAAVVIQKIIVLRFARHLLAGADRKPREQEWPSAAVVLALRGPDPKLAETLRALQRLDYPDYEVVLVVDHATDPVLESVEALRREDVMARVRVSILECPPSTCSLKCSSLIKAVEELDADVEVVAFIDGDALPHPTWLKELVEPLSDPAVGCCGGNRWYMPVDGTFGGLVRYFWNGAASTQMFTNGIPWAGSMAMTRKTVDRIGLLPAWRQALSVDATVHRQLCAHGLKFAFAPGIMMVNREDIGLPEFLGWVTRQMAAARFWHKRHASVMIRGAQVLFVHLAPPLVAGLAAWQGRILAAQMAAVALPIFWLSGLASMGVLEYCTRRVLKARGDSEGWITPRVLLNAAPAFIWTHVAFLQTLWHSLSCSTVKWRGIEYELHPGGKVRMLNYHPYVPAPKFLKHASNRSIV
jgi:cellulose synthase/poly-beta-1,6-N-acetylglucosamine synthase-like glycosyltransferase